MLSKLSIIDLDVKGKRVFVRVDFNVPLDVKGVVQDDLRIRAAIPTLEYLLNAGASLVLASHLGRPKGKKVPEMSLKPISKTLGEMMSRPIKMADDCIGEEVKNLADDLKPGDILLLENLRYYNEETDNDPGFSKELASLANVYVNDAFGAAHRAHASIAGIKPYFEQRAGGLLMDKELEYLGGALCKPAKPFVSIIGGAKVSSKIDVLKNLIDKCDYILLGGAMVYTFMKASGLKTGSSLVEDDKISVAEEIMKLSKEKNTKLVFPSDHLVTEKIESGTAVKTVANEDGIDDGWIGVDIGKNAIKNYSEIISKAETIVWNGPLGVFEIDEFAQGTIKIANAVADSKAMSIVGGGDSASAVKVAGVEDRITHISTGGGACLDFLAGKNLPGIDALSDK